VEARPVGLQAELALSLGLVMLAATLTLGTVLYQFNEKRLRGVLGGALHVEARARPGTAGFVVPGTIWWRVLRDGGAHQTAGPPMAGRSAIDDERLALALRARERDLPLLHPGSPWSEIRFAVPLGSGGDVAVARLPREASARMRATPLVLTGVFLVLDVLIFTTFGVVQARRRVVGPIQRLAEASRELGAGTFGRRLVGEGPREVREVGQAFNEMSGALETRTEDLEKAVRDLRESNRALRDARSGLSRAERMAAVGRLASGVAHEVGNPMGALLAYLSLARGGQEICEGTRDHLDRAAEQGERVRRILKQLLDFSKPPRPERVPLDLVSLARESVELARTQTRFRNLQFEVEAEDCPSEVRGDPGMVAQILLNLVLNAADAVDPDHGRIHLAVRGTVAAMRAGESRDEVAALRSAAGNEAALDAVECVVSDNGSGVGPGYLELVEPAAPFGCAFRLVLPAGRCVSPPSGVRR
jgi:signal transduction histidine kinase